MSDKDKDGNTLWSGLNDLRYFVYTITPFILLILGIIGNRFGLSPQEQKELLIASTGLLTTIVKKD